MFPMAMHDPLADNQWLRRSVLCTLAYFAASGFVPRAMDLRQWLWRPMHPVSLEEVTRILMVLEKEGLVRMQDGGIVLAKSEGLFARQEMWRADAVRKWRVAKRWARVFGWIPGVRAVAVCNSLAWETTTTESDIDFFVVVRRGSIWFVRACALLPLALLRARPGERSQDPVCMSFFLSDHTLTIADMKITPEDPYLTYWVRALVPLVDDGVFAQFWRADGWAVRDLPLTTHRENTRHRMQSFGLWVNWLLWRALAGSSILRGLERLSEAGQRRAFPPEIRAQLGQGSAVIASERALKFHVHDARAALYKRWKELCP